MHAKHDYNPIKTAYPIDSIPPFDEGEYPQPPEAGQSDQAQAQSAHVIIETEDTIQSEQDLALLEKQQKAAFHQSKNYQGAQAYQGQEYEPASTELESKISWGLLIGCVILLFIALLFCGTVAFFSMSM